MAYRSQGHPLDLWLSWPWWAKGGSILGGVLLLLGGARFEEGRRWPRATPPSPPSSSGSPDE
jgi:hypothetical protein